MTIFMSMAGVVGGVCGANRNFTEIMSENGHIHYSNCFMHKQNGRYGSLQ